MRIRTEEIIQKLAGSKVIVSGITLMLGIGAFTTVPDLLEPAVDKCGPLVEIVAEADRADALSNCIAQLLGGENEETDTEPRPVDTTVRELDGQPVRESRTVVSTPVALPTMATDNPVVTVEEVVDTPSPTKEAATPTVAPTATAIPEGRCKVLNGPDIVNGRYLVDIAGEVEQLETIVGGVGWADYDDAQVYLKEGRDYTVDEGMVSVHAPVRDRGPGKYVLLVDGCQPNRAITVSVE